MIVLTDSFTDREKEAYRLLCENLTNKEIAEEMGVSEHSVKKYLQSVYLQLGIESNDPTDKHSARRRAMLLSEHDSEKTYTLEELMRAASSVFGDKRVQVITELVDYLKYS